MEEDVELLRLRAKAKLKLQEEQVPQEELGALDYATRGLNFPGGVARGTVAAAAEPLVGKDLVTAEQIMSGTVPGSAELAEKAGVDLTYMYPSLARNLAKLTGQEENLKALAGATADVAFDPASFLSAIKGTGIAAKAAKTLVNPIGEAVGLMGKGAKKIGSAVYKSAFEKADRALSTRYGKGSIADILKSEKFAGSAEEALQKTQQINENLGQKISNFRTAADTAGVLEKPTEFKKAEEYIQKFRSSPDQQKIALADSLQETLDAYKNMPAKSATELADIKSILRKDFGGDTFMDQLKISQNPEKAEMASKIYSEIAKAEDEAVKKALDKSQFDEYLKAKKDYGVTTKFGQKQINILANQEANRTGIMPGAVDIMGATMAVATESPIGLTGMALKKARDIARLTSSKTGAGLALEGMGTKMQQASQLPQSQLWLQMLQNKGDQQ